MIKQKQKELEKYKDIREFLKLFDKNLTKPQEKLLSKLETTNQKALFLPKRRNCIKKSNSTKS